MVELSDARPGVGPDKFAAFLVGVMRACGRGEELPYMNVEGLYGEDGENARDLLAENLLRTIKRIKADSAQARGLIYKLDEMLSQYITGGFEDRS